MKESNTANSWPKLTKSAFIKWRARIVPFIECFLLKSSQIKLTNSSYEFKFHLFIHLVFFIVSKIIIIKLLNPVCRLQRFHNSPQYVNAWRTHHKFIPTEGRTYFYKPGSRKTCIARNEGLITIILSWNPIFFFLLYPHSFSSNFVNKMQSTTILFLSEI